MTIEQVRNRGYNLMISTLLLLLGLGLGSSAIPEGEWVDKIDDLGLLTIGLAAIGWYRMSGARLERSVVPIVLVLIALSIQIIGVFLEFGDQESFGDNIGGMLILVPLTGIALWEYVRPPRLRQQPTDEARRGGRSIADSR